MRYERNCPIKSNNEIKTLLPGTIHPDLVGFYETNQSHSLVIYPNPAQDMFAPSGLPENGLIQIFNVPGVTVLLEPISTNKHTLDASNFTDGVYLVSVFSEGFYYTTVLVKN